MLVTLAQLTAVDLPLVLLLPALLVLSAFASGSETALFGLSRHRRALIQRRGGVAGWLVRDLATNPRMLLVTLLLTNMTVNTLYFVISSALLLKIGSHHAFQAVALTAGSLLAMIALGEIIPKLLANAFPTRWVQLAAIPLYTLHRLIGPIRLILAKFVITPLTRLIAPAARPPQLSNAELKALLAISQRRGVIDRDEEQLLRQVVALGQFKVRDVMVPRVDLAALEVHENPAELERLIRATHHNKFPIYVKDLDHIIGIAYSRQFLLAKAKAPQGQVNLRKLIRQVRFVPELQRVDQLLADFRKTGTSLAMVVDEYGGTAGMVTLKDVVERVLGDLDSDQRTAGASADEVKPIGPGEWRVGGRLSVHDWSFGPITQTTRAATVGGLVMAILGRLPHVGESVRIGNLVLTVDKMAGRRVEWVRLKLEPRSSKPATPPPASPEAKP